MRFLLTNDDGWGAPGLRALEKVASSLGSVVVVAPRDPLSGISHQLTLESPLAMTEKAQNSYVLDGTPADCVRIGLTQLGIDFDWVLAGINPGANLGADTYVSGTVAAAREGWLQGINAVAFSQYRYGGAGQTIEWGAAEQLTEQMINQLLTRFTADSRCLVNVNFPDLTYSEIKIDEVNTEWCQLDPYPLPASYRKTETGFVFDGVYRDRLQKKGCDIDLCFSGSVAATLLGNDSENPI